MIQGFILEASAGVRMASRWVAGAPEPEFWMGTKVDDKEQHEIQTFRCASCGFLESYAQAS